MNRGLFGASARQAMPFVEDELLSAPAPMGLAAGPPAMGAPRAAPAPGPKSYLGGLIKYQKPEGMTGAQRMALIGATLGDVAAGLQGGQGGGVARVQEQFRANGQREKMRGMMAKLYPDDPEAELMLDLDPSALSRAWLDSKKPVEWETIEADDGIYSVNPRTQESRKLQDVQRRAPSGWEWVDGDLRPIQGGPYDPAYIGQAAGVRRDAVVSRPLPSRARAGGGGGGRGAPKSPWSRKWTP